MSDRSHIEWTDATWNPTRGCTRVSEGCRNCYAEAIAARFADLHAGPPRGAETEASDRRFAVTTDTGPRWTGRLQLIEAKLREPLSWREPRRVFVNSMSDLFHERLSEADIHRVLRVMREARRHTFQVLTKRPSWMNLVMSRWYELAGIRPLANLWLGTSVESMDVASRLDSIIVAPAVVRFVSAEPLLGPLDLTPYLHALGWVIVGGESGFDARPMKVAWMESIVDQCRAARVPVFVKQMGSAYGLRVRGDVKGAKSIPHHLRIREFPATPQTRPEGA